MSSIIWIKLAMDEYYQRKDDVTISPIDCIDKLPYNNTPISKNKYVFSEGFITRLFDMVLYDKNELMKDIVI